MVGLAADRRNLSEFLTPAHTCTHVHLTTRLPTYLHAYISPPKGGNVCMQVGRWAGRGGNPLISAAEPQAAKPSQLEKILQSDKNWSEGSLGVHHLAVGSGASS